MPVDASKGFLNLPFLHPGTCESPSAAGLYGVKGGEKEHWGVAELRKATFTQKNCGFWWSNRKSCRFTQLQNIPISKMTSFPY